MVSNTMTTSVRFRVGTGAQSASSCAANKPAGVSVWTSQLATSPIATAPNGAYGMAAAVRKDHTRGARAFEDPV